METEVLAGPRPAPDFSPYRADIADLQLSPAQENELLGVIWRIMSSFVELGFSVDVCGLLFDEFNDASNADSARVTLLSSPNLETPSDGSEEERLA